MKALKSLQLSTRIFLIVALVIVLPFSAMLWYVKTNMESLLRDEISLKISQNLAKSENEIDQVFGRMANISNVFFHNPEIASVFSDNRYSYYERMVAFDRVIRDISMLNLYNYSTDDIKITFFDQQGRIYASWSLNYQDIGFIQNQDWIKASISAKGYIVWNMSSPMYDSNNKTSAATQISLARSILADDNSGDRLGTIIISIDQKQIGTILDSYIYSELDSIFTTTQDGKILFHNNELLSTDQVENLVRINQDHDSGNSVLPIDNKKFLISFYTISMNGLFTDDQLKIFYLTDYQHLNQQISSLLVKINLISIFFIVVFFLLALGIARNIARPIRVLSVQMNNYRVGVEPLALEHGRKDEIGEIYGAYDAMSRDINDLFLKLKQEQITRNKYQYESLRSKMSPHFLFNTLNTIRWMAIIRQADNIKASIDALAEILRYSLSSDGEMVDLRLELEVINSYCHIQNTRFGNSYSLTMDIPAEIESCQIIRFILQPSIENIFKHAFSADIAGGQITIKGKLADDCLLISIADNGQGFSEASLADFNQRKHLGVGAFSGETAGIGLTMIDERIRVAFGSEFGISLSNHIEGGAQVDYRLPVIWPGDRVSEVATII